MKALSALFLFAAAFYLSLLTYTIGFGLEVKSWPTIILCWFGLIAINVISKVIENIK